MLSRLPITLAQLKQGIKAGKVSKKLIIFFASFKKINQNNL